MIVIHLAVFHELYVSFLVSSLFIEHRLACTLSISCYTYFMYITSTKIIYKIVLCFCFFFEDPLLGDTEILKSEQFVKHKGGVDKTIPAEMHIFIFGTGVSYLMAIYKYLHTAKLNELLW